MNRSRSMLVLVVLMAVATLAGLAPSFGVAPRTLEAQSSCGRFDGKECNKSCQRECSNGSCCEWNTYYYLKADAVPVGP